MPTREELERTLTMPALKLPSLDLVELGFVSMGVAVVGGCSLLGLIVVWWAGLALFFCLLMAFGVSAVREARAGAALAALRSQ